MAKTYIGYSRLHAITRYNKALTFINLQILGDFPNIHENRIFLFKSPRPISRYTLYDAKNSDFDIFCIFGLALIPGPVYTRLVDRFSSLSLKGWPPMQTVFSNSMTAHVWAQQQQPHGRNSTGSLYFNGPTIYSYGGHFPLARFEAGLTLVNSRDSSNTTAKHRHCMFQAIRHCRRSIVHVPMAGQSGDRNRTPEDHAQAIEHFDSLAYRTALKQKRARVHDYSASLANTLDQRTRYAEAFGLSWPDLPLDAAEMARQARTKQAEQYRQWRNGDPVNFPRSYAPTNGSVLLTFRALANGPHVLTSQGVTFPLEHARRAWRLIEGYYRAQDKAPKGASMFPRQDAAPIRLGRYTIDKIEPDGAIRARCHRVSRTEVERMGAILDTRPTAVDAVA